MTPRSGAGAVEDPDGSHDRLPQVIQGGMGVAVSGWRLASAVAATGQLGVVSGTAIAVVVARRLMDGDPGGHVRRALARLPLPGVAERIVDRYFIDGGKPPQAPYRAVPTPVWAPKAAFVELTVAANFVEVHLAKDGHDGPVGINYLHKVQLPTLPSLYGAMLAEVDWVLMGAGIPREIPAVLDRLAAGRATAVRLAGDGLDGDRQLTFDPNDLAGGGPQELPRPRFLAIVASDTLAAALTRDETTRPDGFVVEGPPAGGHNAPPRGRIRLDDAGQPVYGPRDEVDLDRLAGLRLPFWLAGGYGRTGGLADAQAAGAAGIQVGTAFALCDESGLDDDLKRRLLDAIGNGEHIQVITDPQASPTGFPFKVAPLAGTLTDEDVYQTRPRNCDLGYLATPYQQPDGRIDYRCPAEPVDDYTRKGGDIHDTHRRVCLCNALTATVGLAQHRPDGYREPAIVTLGSDIPDIAVRLARDGSSYTASQLVTHLTATDNH